MNQRRQNFKTFASTDSNLEEGTQGLPSFPSHYEPAEKEALIEATNRRKSRKTLGKKIDIWKSLKHSAQKMGIRATRHECHKQFIKALNKIYEIPVNKDFQYLLDDANEKKIGQGIKS